MKKTIRKTLPQNVSIGILIIIFIIVCFLAGQLFINKQDNASGFFNIYFADILVGIAAIIMVLILWEEILFPVNIKSEDSGYVFRNHRSKLIFQVFLYLTIPAIVAFLFFNFEVNMVRFFVWASAILILPVVGKLMSGITNYNDFLKLTPQRIEFKDNDHEGVYDVFSIQKIEFVKDGSGRIHEFVLKMKDGKSEVIQMHQMELDDFFDSIEEYAQEVYQPLL